LPGIIIFWSCCYYQLGVGRPHCPNGLEDTDVRPGGLTIKVVARINYFLVNR